LCVHTHTHTQNARTHTRAHTHTMFEITRTPLLSRKQSILEKNVSDKSCGILNDPFSDLISLTFDGVTKVRTMSLWIF